VTVIVLLVLGMAALKLAISHRLHGDDVRTTVLQKQEDTASLRRDDVNFIQSLSPVNSLL